MSAWTVDATGDYLVLDDSMSLAEHRAAVVGVGQSWYGRGHSYVEKGDGWELRGPGFVLTCEGDPAVAVMRAGRSEWSRCKV